MYYIFSLGNRGEARRVGLEGLLSCSGIRGWVEMMGSKAGWGSKHYMLLLKRSNDVIPIHICLFYSPLPLLPLPSTSTANPWWAWPRTACGTSTHHEGFPPFRTFFLNPTAPFGLFETLDGASDRSRHVHCPWGPGRLPCLSPLARVFFPKARRFGRRIARAEIEPTQLQEHLPVPRKIMN